LSSISSTTTHSTSSQVSIQINGNSKSHDPAGHDHDHLLAHDETDTAGCININLQLQIIPTTSNKQLMQSQSQSQPQYANFTAVSGSETDLLTLGGSSSNGTSLPRSLENDQTVLEAVEWGTTPPNNLQEDDEHHTNHHDHPSRSQVIILGIDISHRSRKAQFISCASGVCCFSLVYGYLQELISVSLCNRQLGLFLAMMQFTTYTFLSSLMHSYIAPRSKSKHVTLKPGTPDASQKVPMRYYLFLSLLRATDAAFTNMAMAYINYPAKTLMKSSRVVFTMLFGTLFARKRYNIIDYSIVTLMVSGLVIFMHADANSSAVFQPIGIIMLTVSLLCDGAITNLSEQLMNQYDIGQDEFIYNLYSITTLGILAAAAARGDLRDGISFLQTPGTLGEIQDGLVDVESSWSVPGKLFAIIVFSSAGFFASSCSAAITKEFGALTMSITSTARKAMTLFLSFALFNHECTFEHVAGTVLFISALVAKSLRASRGCGGSGHCKVVKKRSEEEDYATSISSGSDSSDSVPVKRRRRKTIQFV